MKRLLWIALALLVSACANKPSDELIAQQVAGQLLQQHDAAIFEVTKLRKVNGISRADSRYEAEVEYELRFLVDLKDAADRLQQQGESMFAAGMEATALGLTYGNFKKGDTLHKREWVTFVHSEQGWMLEPKK